MLNSPNSKRKMIFKLVFILVLIQKFIISDGLIFKNNFESINYGLKNKIPVAPTVCKATFTQKLDHFNPTDVRTWNQVYYKDGSRYKKGGPAYLWIEGENEANPNWFEVGYWQRHGKINNALLFVMEHRFYGQSQPFNDTKTRHLKYLTTHQALADIATFIVSMNEENDLPEKTKWIVFGGSYAGNLAAWMRMKYPHLVHGAVASSAPVKPQFDFPEYFDVVSNALASYNEQCRSDIALANNRLERMSRSRLGRRRIGRLFQLCTPLSGDEMDKAFLVNIMASYVARTVQYDRFGKDIQEACDKMLEKSNTSTPVKRYSNLVNFLLSKYGGSCLSTNFTQFVENTKEVDPETSKHTDRCWLYQTCTEYGYYQTTRESNNTFSKLLTLDFKAGWCRKIFRSFFTNEFISQAVNNTNKSFGGLKINVNRIVFIHGEIDPWQVLGITSSTKRSNFETIFIKGASHCSDLRFEDDKDSKDVRLARTKVQFLLSKWLRDER